MIQFFKVLIVFSALLMILNISVGVALFSMGSIFLLTHAHSKH